MIGAPTLIGGGGKHRAVTVTGADMQARSTRSAGGKGRNLGSLGSDFPEAFEHRTW